MQNYTKLTKDQQQADYWIGVVHEDAEALIKELLNLKQRLHEQGELLPGLLHPVAESAKTYQNSVEILLGYLKNGVYGRPPTKWPPVCGVN